MFQILTALMEDCLLSLKTVLYSDRKGVVLADKTCTKNLETLHLARTQFYHLPGFYPKTGFLRNYPLSIVLRPLTQGKHPPSHLLLLYSFYDELLN